MLIAYLQFEGVLPKLQNMDMPEKLVRYQKFYKSNDCPGGYQEQTYIANVAFTSKLEEVAQKWTHNSESAKKTIGELLVGFLFFYRYRFDHERDAIAVNDKRKWVQKKDLI
jgi:hypothetical protein